MNINVHIERLVVEGMARSAAHPEQLQQAVEAELRLLFQDGKIGIQLRRGISLPRIEAASLEGKGSIGSRDLGCRIARSLHAGLSR